MSYHDDHDDTPYLDTSFHDHEMDVDDDGDDFDDEDDIETYDFGLDPNGDREALYLAVGRMLDAHLITMGQAEAMRTEIAMLTADQCATLALFAPRGN